jgi:hypothetical protein
MYPKVGADGMQLVNYDSSILSLTGRACAYASGESGMVISSCDPPLELTSLASADLRLLPSSLSIVITS